MDIFFRAISALVLFLFLFLFLFAIESFGRELQLTFKDQLGVWIDKTTKHPFLGVFTGATATAIVQSSSAEGFVHEGEKLIAVKLKSGEIIKREYLFAQFPQKISTELGIKLGCEINEQNLYIVNSMGQTSVPGVFAAGDCMIRAQSVLAACASGQLAGAAMNMEILHNK